MKNEDGLVENIELFEFHMEKLSKQLCDGDEEGRMAKLCKRLFEC